MTQPGTEAVWEDSVDLVGFLVRSVEVTGPWDELGNEAHVVSYSRLVILVEMVVQP